MSIKALLWMFLIMEYIWTLFLWIAAWFESLQIQPIRGIFLTPYKIRVHSFLPFITFNSLHSIFYQCAGNAIILYVFFFYCLCPHMVRERSSLFRLLTYTQRLLIHILWIEVTALHSAASQEYSLKIYILGLPLTQRCVPWVGWPRITVCPWHSK